MKRGVLLFVTLTILCACYTNEADAQFLKRLFGGKDKKTKEQKKTVKDKPVAAKQIKKREFTYPESVKKKRYRIDVFASLYLNELVVDNKAIYKNKIPDRAVQGIDFYEGVKLASDSLNSLGYQLDVHVHDVTDTNESPAVLIKTKVLESSDLIIGAVQSQHISILAGFAKKHNINFISSLSPSDAGIKDNPYFTLLQPSLYTHCEWISDKAMMKKGSRKPVVFYRTSVPNDETAFRNLNIKDGAAQTLVCNVMPTKLTLSTYLDSTETNTIVVAILDITYAEKLLQSLQNYFPGYTFEIYGMPSWRYASMLKRRDFLVGSVINITAPFCFDAGTPSALAVAGMYKKETGLNKPSEMVYRGFETMFYYANILSAYGTIFNDKYRDNNAFLFTKFDVKLRWDKENNLLYDENKHLYHYRFSDGSSSVQP